MKKFIITNLLLLTLLSLPSTVSAFTGYRTYTNYNLYSACYNNYTAKYAKETDNQYISNYVKKFTNTNKATFWAADGNSKKISKTYDQQVYTTQKINLTTKKNRGSNVRLGMENYNQVAYTATVSGEVDFR